MQTVWQLWRIDPVGHHILMDGDECIAASYGARNFIGQSQIQIRRHINNENNKQPYQSKRNPNPCEITPHTFKRIL